MKKLFAIISILCLMAIAAPAVALDVMLQAPITDVQTLLDKNGNEYVRVIVAETRTLNGVKYQTETPVMAFGAQVDSAKQLKSGQEFKAICASRVYRDRISYTILKVIDK